jgi:hypothetical protein
VSVFIYLSRCLSGAFTLFVAQVKMLTETGWGALVRALSKYGRSTPCLLFFGYLTMGFSKSLSFSLSLCVCVIHYRSQLNMAECVAEASPIQSRKQLQNK